LLIAAPCVIAASWLSLLWWTKALFAEFGYVAGPIFILVTISQTISYGSWAIFHIVGANPAMKSKPSSLRLSLHDLTQSLCSDV